MNFVAPQTLRYSQTPRPVVTNARLLRFFIQAILQEVDLALHQSNGKVKMTSRRFAMLHWIIRKRPAQP